MADAAVLQLILTAKDQASASLAAAGKSSDSLGSKLKGLAVIAGGLVGAFASFKGLASAVSVTQELGSAVSKLSRETGLTVESSSKLLYAFKRVGLDGDDASRSLGFFSKNLLKVSDDAEDGDKALAPVSETLKKLGINALTASGDIRPMDQLLGEVADKFKAMPDGAEKTAFAMQLFGKSGKDLLPILNQGSAGLAELGKQAEKMGLVLSGKNVADIKAFTGAQRELGLAVAGVKLQIGLALMPVLTLLSQILIDVTIRARHLVEAGLAFLREKLIELKPQIDFVKEKFADLYDTLRPLVDKMLELALAALKTTPVLAGLGTAIGLALLPVLGDAIGAFANLASLIAVLPLNPLTILIGAIALLAGGLVYLYQTSEPARRTMDGLAQSIRDFVTPLGPLLLDALTAAGDGLHMLVLGFEGGTLIGGSGLERAAFSLGQTLKTQVIPFIKDVGDGIRLMAAVFAGDTLIGDFGKTQNAFIEAAREIKKSWETEIKPALQAFWDIIVTVVQVIKDNWPTIGPIVEFVAQFAIAQIEGMVQEMHGFIEVISGVVQFIDDLMHGRWAEVWSDVELIVRGVLDLLIGNIKQTFGSIPEIILGLAGQAASAAGDFAQGIYNAIVDFLSALPGKMGEIGRNAANSFLNSISVAGVSVGDIRGVLGSIPGFASGTPYVPQDMLALVHQGERIVPASQNRGGEGGGVTINMPNATIIAGSEAEARAGARNVAFGLAASLRSYGVA